MKVAKVIKCRIDLEVIENPRTPVSLQNHNTKPTTNQEKNRNPTKSHEFQGLNNGYFPPDSMDLAHPASGLRPGVGKSVPNSVPNIAAIHSLVRAEIATMKAMESL